MCARFSIRATQMLTKGYSQLTLALAFLEWTQLEKIYLISLHFHLSWILSLTKPHTNTLTMISRILLIVLTHLHHQQLNHLQMAITFPISWTTITTCWWWWSLKNTESMRLLPPTLTMPPPAKGISTLTTQWQLAQAVTPFKTQPHPSTICFKIIVCTKAKTVSSSWRWNNSPTLTSLWSVPLKTRAWAMTETLTLPRWCQSKTTWEGTRHCTRILIKLLHQLLPSQIWIASGMITEHQEQLKDMIKRELIKASLLICGIYIYLIYLFSDFRQSYIYIQRYLLYIRHGKSYGILYCIDLWLIK